ncbi:MAG: sporulation protein YqfD [Terrisporobacter othiniensis]|uniref:sporulation protein YqfD n=1 Tax=Terrisporobacter othiniensis TaxID=1577792 RepID=UPI0029072545|nr:sporulation protein YqfD [Terrisporobacter othiniensis]MDU6985217.1 sporulation protein YqfD [Terrisporobacter othiniensis]
MISFVRGYYTIVVEGLDTESFLNYLIRNKIYVYNVNRIEKVKIQFNIDRDNYKKLKKIHRSNKFNIKVKKQTGIPFIAKRIYTYRGMVICAIISLIILMSTSQFVTDVYITAPEGIDKTALKKELYIQGVKPGIYKKSIDRKTVRDNIMSKFKQIAYVSINVKGTNIFVNITKKDESQNSEENSNYCNIIATKDGIIEKVVPRSGEAVVEEGDIVKKGDVLVNGANTTALPEVWATTFYEAKKSSNYIDIKNQRTDNKKKVYTISFYDKKYKILRNIKYKDYEIENKTHELKLGDYTFPIKITVSTFYEVRKVENKIDVKKVKEELSRAVLKELDYTIPVSARIVDSKDKYNVNKSMVEYIVTVTTSEDIAQLDILSKSEAEAIIKSNLEKKKQEEGEQKSSNPQNRPINDIRNEFKEEDIKTNTNDKEN